jgi:hypothetical protein
MNEPVCAEANVRANARCDDVGIYAADPTGENRAAAPIVGSRTERGARRANDERRALTHRIVAQGANKIPEGETRVLKEQVSRNSTQRKSSENDCVGTFFEHIFLSVFWLFLLFSIFTIQKKKKITRKQRNPSPFQNKTMNARIGKIQTRQISRASETRHNATHESTV